SLPEKVPTIAQLIRAIPEDSFADDLRDAIERWARHKQSLQGKARVRSMESWRTMLERMKEASTKGSVSAVRDSILNSISNNYTGWDIELRKNENPFGGDGNGRGKNGHQSGLKPVEQ